MRRAIRGIRRAHSIGLGGVVGEPNVSDDGTSTTYETAQAGSWLDPETWTPEGVPGHTDTVTINHAVTLSWSRRVGAGDATALTIGTGGSLTLTRGAILTAYVTLIDAQGTITAQAGGGLRTSSTTDCEIRLRPGTTAAGLVLQGTAAKHCEVSAVGTGTAYVTNGNVSGGGRIDATYTDFSGLGCTADHSDAVVAYWLDSEATFRFSHCTFDGCGRIRTDAYSLTPSEHGYIAFADSTWSDSYEPETHLGNWGIVEAYSVTGGAGGELTNCRFDKIVSIRKPWGWSFEGNVFESRIYVGSGDDEYNYGKWDSFDKNLLNLDLDAALYVPHGCGITNSIIVQSGGTENNPKFVVLQYGAGATPLTGNVLFWTGSSHVAPEGDGFILRDASSGTQASNLVTQAYNIVLPNGAKGPDVANNLSCTLLSRVYVATNISWEVYNNTLFVGGRSGEYLAGIDLGETYTTTAGEGNACDSNLFIGAPGGYGRKVTNIELMAEDTFDSASVVDYNASYRCASSVMTPSITAKGYVNLPFSGSNAVGAHDLDDVDPRFVDATRNPMNWDGDTLADTFAALRSGDTVEDILDWIREGCRPQSEALRGAGLPSRSCDIGAVPMATEAVLWLELTTSEPVALTSGTVSTITGTYGGTVGEPDRILAYWDSDLQNLAGAASIDEEGTWSLEVIPDDTRIGLTTLYLRGVDTSESFTAALNITITVSEATIFGALVAAHVGWLEADVTVDGSDRISEADADEGDLTLAQATAENRPYYETIGTGDAPCASSGAAAPGHTLTLTQTGFAQSAPYDVFMLLEFKTHESAPYIWEDNSDNIPAVRHMAGAELIRVYFGSNEADIPVNPGDGVIGALHVRVGPDVGGNATCSASLRTKSGTVYSSGNITASTAPTAISGLKLFDGWPGKIGETYILNGNADTAALARWSNYLETNPDLDFDPVT